MVFIDATNGEESIELVYDSPEAIPSNGSQQITDAVKEEKQEREDIVQAESLPIKTKGGLFYDKQDGLDQGKSMVKSKPRIDEKIQECIASLNGLVMNPAYARLHPVGKDVQELLSGAITYANENDTSLSAANEILESSLAVFTDACNSAADTFELSTSSTSSLLEYKRCERERQELLKKANVDAADKKREEGMEYLEVSIKTARKDTERVMERQRKAEEVQMLRRFEDKKEELDTLVNDELTELNCMSDNCESDIKKTEKSVEFLGKSAEAAFNKYTETDKELCMRLQENRSEQEELRRRLAALQDQENALEDERGSRKTTQGRAEKTEKRARTELENWKKQIEELYGCCQAALCVMWQFKEGSTKLLESSIESKIHEDKRLQELDIMAQRSLRDALAAALVDAKDSLETCNGNLEMLKGKIKSKKDERTNAARKGLGIFVEEIQKDLKKYKDSYSKFQAEKAQSEVKVNVYDEQIVQADARLQALGEVVESITDIISKVQKEKEAIWETCNDGSLDSLEDY